MKKVLSLLLALALMGQMLVFPASAEETDSRYVVIDELTQSATLIVEPAVDPNAVAMIPDGPSFTTLEEAVAYVQTIPEGERPYVAVLKDCQISSTIDITEGQVNIFPAEQGVPCTITSAAETAFSISDGAVLLINDLNVVTESGKYIFDITDGSSGLLLAANVPCSISGATEAAIRVTGDASAPQDMVNAAVYGYSVSGASILEVQGSNAKVEIASSGTFAATGSEGAFALDGDGHAVDVMMANITGSSAFSMNGDSRISLAGVTFNGEGKYNDPHQEPYAVPGTGAAARVDTNYFGSLEAALAAAAQLKYEDANAVTPLTILKDLTISGQNLTLDAQHSVKLNLAGHTLTIAEGAGLTVNQQTKVHNGTIFVSWGAALDGDITAENTGNIVWETEPMGTISKGEWRMELDSVIYMNYYPKLEGFSEDFDFAGRGGVIIWVGSQAPTKSADLMNGKPNTITLEGMKWNDTSKEWYIQTPEIYAKNIGDIIYIRPYVKNAAGEFVYMTGAVGHSPARFCYDVMDVLAEDIQKRHVCAALLTYGASAQTYFGYNTDNLVNDIPEGWPNIKWADYDMEFSADYLDELDVPANASELVKTMTGVNNKGVVKGGQTLDLQGAIRMSVGFNLDDTLIDAEEVVLAKVMFWSEEDIKNVTSLAYEDESYTAICDLTEASGTEVDLGAYRAKSHHILAKNLSDTVYYYCMVELADGSVYRSGLIAYSPEMCVSDHLADNNYGQQDDLVQRIAVYSEMALRFFQK